MEAKKNLQEPAIYAIMRGLSPQVYYPLNRDINPEIGSDHFAATSSIEYGVGCDAREGVVFSGNDYLKLSQNQKYTGNFSFSLILKFDSFPKTYNGVMGGVIFGNGTQGLGYALGFTRNFQNNRWSFQVYTNTSVACYNQIIVETEKWYHVAGRVSIINKKVEISLWVNGVKAITALNNTEGVIKYNTIIPDFDGNIYMGRVGQSGINYMYGIMQDIAFWNESITDSKVNTLWQYYQSVFPNSDLLKVMNTLSPQVYYSLNNTLSPGIGTDQFASTSGAIEYVTGCDRRKGVLFNGNDFLKLSQNQKYTNSFSFSMVVKFNSLPNTYNGVMGGIIFGDGGYGLGYGLGFTPRFQNNQWCFQVYTRISASCYNPISVEAGKWYHVAGQVSIVNKRVEVSLWVNGIKSTFAVDNTQGVIGYDSINQDFDGNIYMGRVGQSGINYMYGIMQDVAFWNESITDSKINTLWQYYQNILPESSIKNTMNQLNAQVYYSLNEKLTPDIGNIQFASTSGNIQYTTGCDGRKGVLFNGNDFLKLASDQKYTGNFTFSMLIKYDSLPNTYNGAMGGVIFGNGGYGLGYALGFTQNFENNRWCFQVYTKTSVSCYHAEIVETGRWYHVLGRVTITNARVEVSLFINGVRSTTALDNTQGRVFYDSTDQGFDGNIYIGRVNQSGINYTHGVIQDVAFWNSSITDSMANTLFEYYSSLINS